MNNDLMFERLEVQLDRLARELKTVRELASKAVNAMIRAEDEIPESMRRFVTYMHDVHDITYMYEERGLPVPGHLLDECERCDDRMRQLLKEHHIEGGAFSKVRRDMASDPENRWDHTRLLTSNVPRKDKPNGQTVEPEQELEVRRGEESRTDPESNQPRRREPMG